MVLTPWLVFVLVAVGSASRQAVPPIGPDRIRPLDRLTAVLIEDGRRRSSTVESLVQCLQSSAVIAYISSGGPDLPARGTLSFLGQGGGFTYLMMRLSPLLAPADRLPMLGHELQHACEVARAPDPVESATALGELYRRIGFPSGVHAFESAAAQAVEASVRREIVSAHTRR